MQKYSDELKASIINDYEERVFGYKKIAEKYGLTRDTVRSIISGSKKKKKKDILLSMKNIDE